MTTMMLTGIEVNLKHTQITDSDIDQMIKENDVILNSVSKKI